LKKIADKLGKNGEKSLVGPMLLLPQQNQTLPETNFLNGKKMHS